MKTTNHTPGPWDVTEKAIIGNNGGTWIAEHPAVKWQILQSITKSGDAIVAESIKQAIANANLIAACPDMFDALQAIVDAFGDQDSLLIDQCKAALAKAKGEAK